MTQVVVAAREAKGTSQVGSPQVDPLAVAEIFGDLALKAGVAVMHIYQRDPNARVKADHSPVCDADEAAEAVLLAGLAERLPQIPVVSEEAAARGDIPRCGKRFILVDPVDGTKEFLSANGEFTINLALIQDGAPVAGAVYAPALGVLWLGAGHVAWRCEVAPGADLPPEAQRAKIRGRRNNGNLVALISRSHPDGPTEDYLARMGISGRRSAGSSLKFCLLAEGEGDIYPRCGPTMQWDVAAGDAVLRAAGGIVVDAKGEPFRYGLGPDGYRNGPFVAWADPERAATATLR